MSLNVATYNTICSIFVDIYYSYVFVDVLTDITALQYILRRHCDVMYWLDAILTLFKTIFVNYTPDIFFLILLRNLKVLRLECTLYANQHFYYSVNTFLFSSCLRQ